MVASNGIWDVPFLLRWSLKFKTVHPSPRGGMSIVRKAVISALQIKVGRRAASGVY